MSVRIVCVLACLAGWFTAAVAFARTDPQAGVTEGRLTVPGKDIIFKGQFALPLSPLGGFQIEVKLPQKGISASECGHDSSLSIQMGDVTPPNTNLNTPRDEALAKKKQDYYADLVKRSKENKTVTIAIQGRREFLTHRNGKLYAPYCIVAFSGFDE